MSAPAFARSGAVLSVDLGAVVANWRMLQARAAPAECAAVVKADAYGLGAAEVAPALAAAGCRVFFVASLDEGLALRRCLEEWREAAATAAFANPSAVPPPPAPPAIFLLNGAPRGAEADLAQNGLIPVLNGLHEIEAWALLAAMMDVRLPAALHVDTGMSRLGLPRAELDRLSTEPERLDGVFPVLVMSHLACADEPAHDLNERQRAAFDAARARLPAAPASLANSSGIFLGGGFVFDLVRPGAALYGVSPTPAAANPMQGVARLDGRILQVREIDSEATVGYGATYRSCRTERIATVAVGYADGFLRSSGNRGCGYLGSFRVPLVGRVSMDLITFDVTDAPVDLAQPGAAIELIGPQRPVDAVAEDAGTIGYEVLTALGTRYARVYRPATG